MQEVSDSVGVMFTNPSGADKTILATISPSWLFCPETRQDKSESSHPQAVLLQLKPSITAHNAMPKYGLTIALTTCRVTQGAVHQWRGDERWRKDDGGGDAESPGARPG